MITKQSKYSYRFFKVKNTVMSQEKLDEIAAKKKQKSKVKKDPRLAGLVIGQPLPDDGTCKHYKRSMRWFLFQCCQRAFPCDECHDEAKTDKHQLKMAIKQYCGLCSRQLNIALKKCVCGNDFDMAAKQYWEGGKGARNKTQLSTKDSHKYAGLSKTVSNKKKSQQQQ